MKKSWFPGICLFQLLSLNTNGGALDADYDLSVGTLSIPAIEVPSLGFFSAELQLFDEAALIFDLTSVGSATTESGVTASFSPDTGQVLLPDVRAFGVRYEVSMSQSPVDSLKFTVASATVKSDQVQQCEANVYSSGSGVIDGPSGPDGPDNDSVFRSLTVSPLNPDVIYLGTERNGFLKSEDGGQNWTRYRQGLVFFEGTDNYPEIWDMVVHPQNDEVVYAATLDSPGPVTGDYPSTMGGVYKSISGGADWFRASCDLTTSRATSIAINSKHPDQIILGLEGGAASFSQLAGQYFSGGIFRSEDDGGSWQRITVDDNDGVNGYWRIVPYGDGDSFITFGTNRDDPARNVGFVRLTQGGLESELFAPDLQTLIIPWFDVSADGQVIYAVEEGSFKIRKSEDAGSSWEEISVPVNGPVAVSPADSQTILFAQTFQLRRSGNGGTTSDVVLQADASVHDIVFAPSNPSIVYVATEGYLIYKSTDGGESFGFMGNLRESVLND